MHYLVKANGHYDFHNHVLYNSSNFISTKIQISSLWYEKTHFLSMKTQFDTVYNDLFYESNVYSHINEQLVLKENAMYELDNQYSNCRCTINDHMGAMKSTNTI